MLILRPVGSLVLPVLEVTRGSSYCCPPGPPDNLDGKGGSYELAQLAVELAQPALELAKPAIW